MNVTFNYDGEKRTLEDIKRENRNTGVAAIFITFYIILIVFDFVNILGYVDLTNGIEIGLAILFGIAVIVGITLIPMVILYIVKYGTNINEQKRRYILNQIIGNKYEVGYFNGKLTIKKSYKYYDEEHTETMDFEKFVEKVFSKLENKEIINNSTSNDNIKVIFDISFLDDSVAIYINNKEA